MSNEINAKESQNQLYAERNYLLRRLAKLEIAIAETIKAERQDLDLEVSEICVLNIDTLVEEFTEELQKQLG